MSSLFAEYDVRSLYEGVGLALSPVTGSLEYRSPDAGEPPLVHGTLAERVERFRQHFAGCGGRSFCLSSGDHVVLRCVFDERGMQGVVVEPNNALGYVEGDIAIRRGGFGHREFYLMMTAPQRSQDQGGSRVTLYARVPPPPPPPARVPEPTPPPAEEPPRPAPQPAPQPAPRRQSRLSWFLPRAGW